ncbi:MAG: AraC family transcriptional regulator [Verrucomicrobiales bacterium]|nr:AraC family transcriptional regulator [Verrucomicrobiales bacterium]
MSPAEKGDGFPGQRIVVLPRRVVATARNHPLLDGQFPTDVGFFPSARGHFRERPNGAEQTIFIHCSEGRGWCRCGGKEHPVGPADLIVIPPQVSHAYAASAQEPWTIRWFHAVGSRIPVFARELGTFAEQPVVRLPAEIALASLFEEMLGTLEQGYTPAHLLYASQILSHLLGRMVWCRNQTGRETTDPHHRVAQSLEYMKQNLSQRVRVQDLAKLAGLSLSHYSALFRDLTGYAPMEYFIGMRMHQARQLLDTTALSIKEIAAQVGYDDPLYFSRAFHEVNDVSPTQYRDERKG